MISTLVIGGGIGGLSLARELALRHLPVTVLEKAPQLNPVGAGIIMNPNAMRVLERNGLAGAVRLDSWPYLLRETCDSRGRSLAMRDYRPLYEAGKLSVGALVHRAHLLDALYRSLPPAAVRFNVSVTKIDLRPDRVRAETERGEVFEADLLVGADGIHSQVRSRLFGELRPRYMGYRSHRLIVDNEAGVRHFTELMGRGQRIGLVPISASRLYVWTTFNSPQAQPPVFDSVSRFRDAFRQFTDERISRVFSQLRSMDGVISTDIEEMALDAASLGSTPWCASRAKSARTGSARAPSAAGSGTAAFAARGGMRRKCRLISNGCWPKEEMRMARIRHIAITAEDPFATAELFKKGFGLQEIARGDSELAREVYLTDGYINVAIVCWKRTKETPNPYPEGYGLDHFGLQVDDLEGAEARVKAAGATPQPPPPVDLSKLDGRLFFEKKYRLAGVKFDLSKHGWPIDRDQ